jgi:hypothetical protein
MTLKEKADMFANSCRKALVGGVIGVGTVVAAGTLAGAAVPWAMSSFGTVVSGVGTVHTSATAGGIAANLQMMNIGLLTSGAMTTGATVGACLRTAKPIKTTWSIIKTTARLINNNTPK